jgi:hypothetical protein
MAFLQKLKELPDTGTVSVACRTPRGLRLDLPHPDDPRQEIPFAVLRGWSIPEGTFHPGIVHKVGITTGVDAQKFKRWHELMVRAKFPLVVNGDIFAFAGEDDVKAKAREEQGRPQVNGRLDPENPGVGLKPDNRGED